MFEYVDRQISRPVTRIVHVELSTGVMCNLLESLRSLDVCITLESLVQLVLPRNGVR